MGMLGILNIVGLVLLGHEKMAQIFLVTCTLPSLLFFWIISENHDGRFLFTFCLSDTFSYWILIITNLLDFYLGNGQCIIMFFSRLVAFPLVEWFAWRYLRKPYLELQKNVKKGWMIATGLSATYYLLMIVVSGFPVIITKRPEDIPCILLVLFLMPFTYATILFALYQQLLVFRTKENDRMLSMQKERLEARLESYESTRRLVHDMQAFHTALVGLLENQKYEEAQHLVSKIKQRSEKSNINYCDNPYMNAVLNQYSQKFKDKEAELEIVIQIGNITLPGMKLSLILSNALDNALRAVSELEKERRKARIYLRQKEKHLLLRICNFCDLSLVVPLDAIPATTKTEPGHGYGLPSIYQTAEDLGGNAVCYAEKGEFVLDVHLMVQNLVD